MTYYEYGMPKTYKYGSRGIWKGTFNLNQDFFFFFFIEKLMSYKS